MWKIGSKMSERLKKVEINGHATINPGDIRFGNRKMKVYVVKSTPHGECFDFIGVFSTLKKAEGARDRWNRETGNEGNAAFQAYIVEVEVDEYIAYYPDEVEQ